VARETILSREGGRRCRWTPGREVLMDDSSRTRDAGKSGRRLNLQIRGLEQRWEVAVGEGFRWRGWHKGAVISSRVLGELRFGKVRRKEEKRK
jgi:hypothetical protein